MSTFIKLLQFDPTIEHTLISHMPNNSADDLISSTFSTGGGGNHFENKVQTGLLASLLVGAHIPGLESALLTDLNLQMEHAGYETDDAVLFATDSQGRSRRQLWSVKHDVKFTEKDPVFRDVLIDAWLDFSNPSVFDSSLDSLVLATGPLPGTYKNLFSLLEIIRGTSSFDNFERKTARKGFIAKEAQDYFLLITKLLGELSKTNVNRSSTWAFLKCFNILGFDFDQAASQDEARFKTLLGISIRAGSGGSGSDLWNKIFKWVAENNPRGGSFRRQTLPDEWQQETTSVAVHFESGGIHRLDEHSKLNLKRIRGILGIDLQLPRVEVTDTLALHFSEKFITLVSGEAGVGKSAASMQALRVIANGAPVFVFQAKEFARTHLDEALATMRITESIPEISSLFALHPRKYILLESVERLLEAPERDAFSDLLSILVTDASWRIIFTCRQHAIPLVRSAFLGLIDLQAQEVTVPRLSPSELEWVLEKKLELKKITGDARTKNLLRNPWFLDKACSINWQKEGAEKTIDQIRLREILWKQVVCRDDAREGGIHRKRDRVFREIALKRAKSLQSFVLVSDFDEVVVQALLADELLVEDSATGAVAPAHDVLEDWALVRWIAEVLKDSDYNPVKAFSNLGHWLPIRRAYRQWLQETLDGGDLQLAREFTNRVLSDATIPTYWRDETVISLLLSEEAFQFIQEHEAQLLKNNKSQLRTVIHLLRLACKKPNPQWNLPEHILAETFGDMHLVPEGNAWNATIELIHRHLAEFTNEDLPIILGLLEDWKSGLAWRLPQEPGTRAAGLIAIHFWNHLKDSYQYKKVLKRILEITLSLTQAIPVEFEKLVRLAIENKDNGQKGDLLEEMLLVSFQNGNACRSHPNLILDFAKRKWWLDRSVPEDSYSNWGGGSMESHFGLARGHAMRFFPSSALQGPFYALLNSNPDIGIELILDLVNISTLRYVKNGLDKEYGDQPIDVEIEFSDGSVVKHWANVRLWLLYRGSMPGPDVLQSALMALEKYLLDLAETEAKIEDLVKRLLVKSNSISITSVVASVGMAYPEAIGDSALALLREPLLLEFDLQRYVHDQRTDVSGEWGYDHLQKMYHNERIQSGKLPHRKENLESLCCKLQTGPLRDQVWKIIDEIKDDLESIKPQSERIKLLRLKFHRMDLRNFQPSERLADGRVLFQSKPPEADIAEVLDKHAPTQKSHYDQTEVLMWGLSVFERREPEKYSSERWSEMLSKAQVILKEQAQMEGLELLSYEGGPGYIAAVCVRDHWDKLDTLQKDWCRELLISKILENKDTSDEIQRMQTFSMSSQVAAAKVMPLLYSESDGLLNRRINEAIAVGLTHAVEEVRGWTAQSIGENLWVRNPNLASHCVSELLVFASLHASHFEKWEAQPWNKRGKWEEFLRPELILLRKSLADVPIEAKNSGIYFASAVHLKTVQLVASILSKEFQNPIGHSFYRNVASYFVELWKREDSKTQKNEDSRDYHAEAALKQSYANYLVFCESSIGLTLWRPFSEAIDHFAKEVSDFFESLVVSEDSAQKGSAFWAVWSDTRDSLLKLPKLNERLEYERGGVSKLASALLFDGVIWKEAARDWKPAHGHEKDLHTLVQAVGCSPATCKSLIRLLSGIGAFLLPNALLWIDEILKKGSSTALIGSRNELFNLARILTPFVFGRTSLIRNDKVLREATLRILDAMVIQGSSSAYRMRDFLISPFSSDHGSLQSASTATLTEKQS